MSKKTQIILLFCLELVCIVGFYLLESYMQAILLTAVSGYAYGRFKERGEL